MAYTKKIGDDEVLDSGVIGDLAGSRPALVICGTATVEGDVTVPKKCTLWFQPGGRLVVPDGSSLVIKGPLIAPNVALFEVEEEGQVQIGRRATAGVDPQWFGARPDHEEDDTRAIQLAIDTGHPHVVLAPGIYKVEYLNLRDRLRISAGVPGTAILEHVGPIALYTNPEPKLERGDTIYTYVRQPPLLTTAKVGLEFTDGEFHRVVDRGAPVHEVAIEGLVLRSWDIAGYALSDELEDSVQLPYLVDIDYGSSDISIRGNEFQGARGVRLNSWSPEGKHLTKAARIEGNLFVGEGRERGGNGIAAFNVTNFVAGGNEFRRGVSLALLFSVADSTARDIRVIDNRFDSAIGTNAMIRAKWAADVENVTVSRNHFARFGRGVATDESGFIDRKPAILVGQQIDNSADVGGQPTGWASWRNIVISDNTMVSRNGWGYGILVGDASSLQQADGPLAYRTYMENIVISGNAFDGAFRRDPLSGESYSDVSKPPIKPANTPKPNGSESLIFSTGIYITKAVCGVVITGNTIRNCARPGIWLQGGSDIVISGNVIDRTVWEVSEVTSRLVGAIHVSSPESEHWIRRLSITSNVISRTGRTARGSVNVAPCGICIDGSSADDVGITRFVHVVGNLIVDNRAEDQRGMIHGILVGPRVEELKRRGNTVEGAILEKIIEL